MNTIYTNNHYCIRNYSSSSRRSLFRNKAADLLVCAACTMGVIAALFFLLTL